MVDLKFNKLTEYQKLQAIQYNFYLGGHKWYPKKGDYYTTTRADLELYQIVDEDDEYFYTSYLPYHEEKSELTSWTKENFLNDFGQNRIFVPLEILKIE